MTGLQTSSKPVAADSSAGVSPDVTPVSASPRRWARSLAETVGWIGLFAALFAGWAWYQTGTLSLIAPYLQGERLLVRPTHLAMGQQHVGAVVERSVQVVNMTGSGVTFLGAQKNCGCIALDEFPLTIPSGQVQELKLAVKMPVVSAKFEQSVKFFTDYDNPSSFSVMVTATAQ